MALSGGEAEYGSLIRTASEDLGVQAVAGDRSWKHLAALKHGRFCLGQGLGAESPADLLTTPLMSQSRLRQMGARDRHWLGEQGRFRRLVQC